MVSAPTAAPPAPRKPGVGSAIGWSYVLSGGRIGSTVLVTFVLAKLLGPSEFGVVAMATVFITIAQTILQQGLVSAIVQRDKLTSEHLDAAFGVMVISGFVVGGAAAALSPVWALVNREPQLTTVCLALSPLVLMQALTIVPEAVLRRELAFKSVAVRTLSASVVSGVVGVVLALLGAGVWALVAQSLVNAFVGLVVLWTVCPWRPSRRPRLGAVRDLWKFSMHSANAGLGSMLSSKADLIFTGLFFGPVATGIYRLAARLPDMLVDVTVRSLQQVALPSLSRLQNDRPAFIRHLTTLQHLGAITGLPLLGVLVAGSGPLVGFLGPQWAGTEVPLALLCLYGALNAYGVLLGPALQAIGQPAKLAVILWTRGLLGVGVFAGVGTLLHDSTAARQATAIALAAIGMQIVMNAASVWVTVSRAVGGSIPRFLAPTLPAVLAGGVAAAVPLLFDAASVSIEPPLLALFVYCAVAAILSGALLWVLDRRLRTLVRKKLGGRLSWLPLSHPRTGRHEA
ncbi:lipopolysaccharide biosynthesis protein [Asanoa ishikariensis]|uniref:Polysaccharide transporter, PST family n=1 Tax=Asanoa ishikariensis TaxID=137265 RepID=A0A1H3RCA1_9ACTN|nr:lipopolysaccharide biosynthesis protein [Asanoa ishikariensis]GIF64164.1 lipopolysaccharide biosynthesis protein [Asanoa ishikariensis]SDZ23462.1 polysaccharide transporter, PST family [Asanoa ishikariensis]